MGGAASKGPYDRDGGTPLGLINTTQGRASRYEKGQLRQLFGSHSNRLDLLTQALFHSPGAADK